ncbi:MAG: PDZ domain-containing protein [Bacillota bacterium]
MFSLGDFLQLTQMLVQSFMRIVFTSQDAIFFWLIVFLLAMQYSRMQKTKEAWFGRSPEPTWQPVLMAVASGLLGGLAGSFLMVFVGINLADIGIGWLWPLAILLMLLHPRLLCFSYAGGIISLSSLLFGFPMINVPQLMALVALLHMIEALLIYISGHLGAVPVYIRNKAGQVTGAFNLQKLWPIPIVALAVMNIPLDQLAGSSINMPDWWPLIKPGNNVDPDQLTYVLLPVIAALGYGDLAVTARPQEKSRKSALNLFFFSFVLMSLAVLASHFSGFALLAALFSPLGHELVIWWGQREELKGSPLYVQPEQGVRILDVFRESPAAKLGLKSGDVIMNVNGWEVNSKEAFFRALEESWGVVEVEWRKYPEETFMRNTVRKTLTEDFGIILVPGAYDRPMVEFSNGGILGRWLKKKMGRKFKS